MALLKTTLMVLVLALALGTVACDEDDSTEEGQSSNSNWGEMRWGEDSWN